MPPYNCNTIDSECCNCADLSEQDFSIDFNKNIIKIIIRQDSNIILEGVLKKKVLDGRIIYRKQNVNNELLLDKDICIEIYNEDDELYFGMVIQPHILNIVNDDNRKFCYLEYMENKAITFNLSQIENNKIIMNSVYLSYKI